MATERPPFEESQVYIHETLTFAFRVQALVNRNPMNHGMDFADRQDVMLKWLDELLPAVDSYRATLRILKAAYERGEL